MTAPAIEVIADGISRGAADGLYVRRFVGATLAADTYAGTNIVGNEIVFSNPNGPVMGAIPANASSSLMNAEDGGRFGGQISVLRLNTSANIFGQRVNTSFQAPTQVLSGQRMVSFAAQARTNTGTLVTPSAIGMVLRENATATGFGSLIVFQATDIGSAVLRNMLNMRTNGIATTEVHSELATLRLVPLTSGALRNPANTQDQVAWNATGYGVHGSAPIAKPTITGSRGGNAALASLLTALALYGHITDSTTA